MTIWTADSLSLLGLIVLGALLLVLHAALWLQVLRCPRYARIWRVLAGLPPLTPVMGFACRQRLMAVLWCIVVIAYLVLRSRV